MTLFERIGDKLREARERTGLTQDMAASSIGIHRVQLSQYENGKREIDLSTLAKLATLYGYSVNYVLGETEEEEQVNVAFRAEDVSSEDLELIAWAKGFVLAASELECILEGGHRSQ